MHLPTNRRPWRSIRDTDEPRQELAYPAMGTLLLMGAGTGTSVPAKALVDKNAVVITDKNGVTIVSI